MSMTRSPEQRARFVRAAATDLDTAPELAARLLFLSETARQHAGSGARPSDSAVRALLDCLLDDEVCRHGWWVADEGEALWRLLIRLARPPRDVGPAVLLAMALARRDAVDEALGVLLGAMRAGEFRRPAVECAAELAETAAARTSPGPWSSGSVWLTPTRSGARCAASWGVRFVGSASGRAWSASCMRAGCDIGPPGGPGGSGRADSGAQQAGWSSRTCRDRTAGER